MTLTETLDRLDQLIDSIDDMELSTELSFAYPDLSNKVRALIAERNTIWAALISISKNTCCSGCREAAIIARKALEDWK